MDHQVFTKVHLAIKAKRGTYQILTFMEKYKILYFSQVSQVADVFSVITQPVISVIAQAIALDRALLAALLSQFKLLTPDSTTTRPPRTETVGNRSEEGNTGKVG